MPSYRITAPDGRTFQVTAPEGATEADVLARVKSHAEQTTLDLPLDLGTLGHAAKLFVGAESPKNLTDYATLALTTAPAVMAGGPAGLAALGARLGPRLAAALGRIGTSAGIGAGRAAIAGEGPKGVALSALLDGVISGATEGLVSGAASGVKAGPVKLGLKEWGAPQRGFEYATGAPAKALGMIEQRLPQGAWLNVPSLSKQPMTARDAVAELTKLEGPQFTVARRELASELDRLDLQRFVSTPTGVVKGPRPYAGQVFSKFTSPDRFQPGAFAKGAEATRRGLTSNEVRSALDALGVTTLPDIDPAGGGGIPTGAAIGSLAWPAIAKRIGLGDEEHRAGGGGY